MLVIDRRNHAFEPLSLGPLRGHDSRLEGSKRRTVVQVRERDDVAVGREPAGHARKLRPYPECIHVEHDGRPDTAAGRRG